jgi:uncharacterized protein (TIGR03435 family)
MQKLSCVLLAGWLAFVAEAQSAEPLHFEVASIRPDESGRVPFPEPCGQPCGGFEVPAGQRFVGASTLDQLLWVAYGRTYADITGGPKWKTTEMFQIDARADQPRTSAEIRRMVRALLEDRFKLRTHVEKRQMAVYRLVLARKDGKLGPGLKPAADTAFCANPVNPGSNDRGRCGSRMTPAGIRVRNGTIQEMGDIVSESLERPVIDRTGLKGRFDIDVEAQLDFDRFGPSDQPKGSGPIIFTALREQLGLKLESAKESVQILVVDSLERPSAN